MAIKQSESRTSLKQKLKSRGVIFEDEKLDNALKQYNYFNLFNGQENLLLSSHSPKYFNKVSLDDFIVLYKFNKKLSATVLEILDNIESKLKNSISHHFTRAHCCSINDTMAYTDRTKFVNPQNGQYANNYPFVNYQNNKVYHQFNQFILFKPYYLTNLINNNDHINVSFYTDSQYSRPSTVAAYRTNNNGNITIHNDVAVPFWVAIETMKFGEVTRLLHYLHQNDLSQIMGDFGVPYFYRSEFLNMFDLILSLRNYCAHGSLIFRYRSPKYIKLNANLVSRFNLTPSQTGSPSSVLSLFDVLKVVNFFESTSPLKKVINGIIYRNNKHFKSPDFDLNSRLLTRMGNSELKEWKKFIFNGEQFQF